MSQESSSETSSFVDESWIQWFCNLAGNHFFCAIDKGYIDDTFNLFGLKQHLPKDYNKALDTILDRLGPAEAENEELSRSAALLYGLIHARYIVTTHGLEVMHRKYVLREFGECPRTFCRGQAVLPMGFMDEPKHGAVKLFCPRCQDIYSTHSSYRHIDGAFFGPTFPNLFMMSFEELVPEQAVDKYIPRIFGFKIHKSSKSLPTTRSDPKIETVVFSSSPSMVRESIQNAVAVAVMEESMMEVNCNNGQKLKVEGNNNNDPKQLDEDVIVGREILEGDGGNGRVGGSISSNTSMDPTILPRQNAVFSPKIQFLSSRKQDDSEYEDTLLLKESSKVLSGQKRPRPESLVGAGGTASCTPGSGEGGGVAGSFPGSKRGGGGVDIGDNVGLGSGDLILTTKAASTGNNGTTGREGGEEEDEENVEQKRLDGRLKEPRLALTMHKKARTSISSNSGQQQQQQDESKINEC